MMQCNILFIGFSTPHIPRAFSRSRIADGSIALVNESSSG